MEFWHVVSTTIGSEFNDIPNLEEATRDAVRLIVAAIFGGILGIDREMKHKTAGLRTHMLVSLGSALFILIPLQSHASMQDMSRVLQGLIAGVGFLGAGAIIKVVENHEAKGLTTAASLWMAAAIGIAMGMGHGMTALLATFLALIILSVIPVLEKRIGTRKETLYKSDI